MAAPLIPEFDEFSIGAVIVPARDGMLAPLGHDVQALGQRALGVVIETKANKALVQFPELNLTLWLNKNEMADVEARSLAGESDYKRLMPDLATLQPDMPIVWWIWALSRQLPVSHVLSIENGTLREVWSEHPSALSEYADADPETPVTYVGLGIEELKLKSWYAVEAQLGSRLLFARFLPAGMHKLELALYLRAY